MALKHKMRMGNGRSSRLVVRVCLPVFAVKANFLNMSWLKCQTNEHYTSNIIETVLTIPRSGECTGKILVPLGRTRIIGASQYKAKHNRSATRIVLF